MYYRKTPVLLFLLLLIICTHLLGCVKAVSPSILNSIRPAPLPMLYSKASLPGARHILQSSNPLHAHFNVNFFWFFEQQKLVCFLQTVWFIVSFDVNAYALNIGLPLLMYVQRIQYVYVDRKAACSEHLVLKTYLSSSNNFVNVSYLYEMYLAFYLNADSHSFTNMLRICFAFFPGFSYTVQAINVAI